VVVDVRKDPLGVETDDRETTIDRNCHAAGVSLLLQTGLCLVPPVSSFRSGSEFGKKIICSFDVQLLWIRQLNHVSSQLASKFGA
jgi:hypothetical protein